MQLCHSYPRSSGFAYQCQDATRQLTMSDSRDELGSTVKAFPVSPGSTTDYGLPGPRRTTVQANPRSSGPEKPRGGPA